MSTKKAKSGKQASISAHPAFPAVVASWFAALLGLGCLVVPVVLFETLISASGVASVVPAAAPPLGLTARMAIALAAALTGAGIGLFLARKVAAASGETKGPRERQFVADADAKLAPKRPISARDELGSDSLDEPVTSDEHEQEKPAPAVLPGRRRALSVTDESERSEYLDAAPLPGGHVTFDEKAFGNLGGSFSGNDDAALDLGDFAAEDDNEENDLAAQELLETLSLRNLQHAETSPQERPFDSPGQPEAVVPDSISAGDHASSPHRPFDAASGSGSAQPIFEASPQDILREELTAMSTTSNVDVTMKPADTTDTAYNPLSGHAAREEQLAAPFRAPAAPTQAAAPVQAEPAPQDMGMVELVERFARALQQSGAPVPSAMPQIAAAQPAAIGNEPEPAATETAPAQTGAPAPAAPAALAAPAMPAFAVPAPTPAPGVATTFASGPGQAAEIQTPSPAPLSAPFSAPEAPEEAPQPMVFRRQTAAEVPAPFAAPPVEGAAVSSSFAEAETNAIPQALQPLAFNEPEADVEDESEPLNLAFPSRPASPAPGTFQAPEMAPPGADDDDDDSEAYSSLLSMKGRFGQQQSFVRIDDDEPAAAGQPVVVFPGQENRRAEPASDGPTRDPLAAPAATPQAPAAMRPFDGPAQAPVAGAVPAERANAGETEKALRDALEKLQRMSGTG
uniref:hypothetical protein n=1 Tax=Parerythrobacter lutipelagi TaxID=1964208 RepID=UPI0010F59809|nr:hypothetical protein [Parerythrobacter lutipelagi]